MTRDLQNRRSKALIPARIWRVAAIALAVACSVTAQQTQTIWNGPANVSGVCSGSGSWASLTTLTVVAQPSLDSLSTTGGAFSVMWSSVGTESPSCSGASENSTAGGTGSGTLKSDGLGVTLTLNGLGTSCSSVSATGTLFQITGAVPPSCFAGFDGPGSGGSGSFSLTNSTTAFAYILTGGVVPVYSTVPVVSPGSWISIYGHNLAAQTALWTGNFPTSLGGVSVTIDGKPGYLWFVSPTQINLQTPSDSNSGTVDVIVTTTSGRATSTVTLSQFSPSFDLLDAKHISGIILRRDGSGAYGGGTYDIIGPTGTSLGYGTVAAKAGDVVELFAVGLGPTSPLIDAGNAFTGAAAIVSPATLLINNTSVTPAFVGLSGAGLYQVNLTIPAGLGTGDVAISLAVGDVQTPPRAVISLQ